MRLRMKRQRATFTQERSPASAKSRSPRGKRFDRVMLPELFHRLDTTYPGAVCALHHRNAYEILVATILSAQCTDARVNQVTPSFFRRFPTPQALSRSQPHEVEELIRSTGFFRNKAKNLIGMAQALIREFQGEVPNRMEDLVRLPGVARKTANVVLGVIWNIPSGVVVDTHVQRITQLLGLTRETSPTRIEQDLMRLIPRARWVRFGHQIIHHGRRICIARRPRCAECSLSDLCPSSTV